jgi:hypothetical protein
LGPQDANQGDLDELIAALRDRVGPGAEKTPRNESSGRDSRMGHTTDCLSTMQIAQLATVSMEPQAAASMLDHIRDCGSCSARLREAKEDLGRELSQDEKKLMTSLESTTTEWQTAMAANLARPGRNLRPSRLWFLAVAAAVVVLAFGGWFYFVRATPERIEHMLTQAYSAGRPFEFRLDLPSYAPVRQQAGRSADLEKPLPLISAQERLIQASHTNPDDPRIQRLSGIYELLEREPDQALAILKKASDSDPNDVRLKVDLAVAYALRGEANRGGSDKNSADYGAAENLLAMALERDPSNQAALFNIAIVSERLEMYEAAIGYWKRYIEHDNGPWKDEAQQRLDQLSVKKKTTITR